MPGSQAIPVLSDTCHRVIPLPAPKYIYSETCRGLRSLAFKSRRKYVDLIYGTPSVLFTRTIDFHSMYQCRVGLIWKEVLRLIFPFQRNWTGDFCKRQAQGRQFCDAHHWSSGKSGLVVLFRLVDIPTAKVSGLGSFISSRYCMASMLIAWSQST